MSTALMSEIDLSNRVMQLSKDRINLIHLA